MEDKELKLRHEGSVDSDGLVEQVEELSVAPTKHFSSETKSALKHYEQAIQLEANGKLKASVEHYKKAYKVSRIVSRHHLRPKLIKI